MPDLPINIDATHADDPADPSRAEHQRHHDTIHQLLNLLEMLDEAPADGEGVVWDSTAGLWVKTSSPVVTEASGGAAYVAKAGDTMTGNLTVSNAEPKLFFDETDTTTDYRIAVSGGQMFLQVNTGAGYVTIAQLNSSRQVLFADGSAATPGLAFAADPDTGIFTRVANHLMFATGGVEQAYIAGDGAFRIVDGTAALPAFSFKSDTDTGLLRGGADIIDVTLGGVLNYRFSGGNFAPHVDNARTLGNSTNRWSAVWAANGTIQTSDETQKNTVTDTSLGKDFVKTVRPIEFKFNGGERVHQGFSAQQVKETLTALGIPDSAAFIDPAVGAAKRELEGPPPQETDESDEDYAERVAQWQAEIDAEKVAPKGLRYSELIPPLYRAFQEQQAEIDGLRAETATLKATVVDLAARVEALEAA